MKKWLMCMLAALLLFGCARAAVSVRMEEGAALLKEDGGVIAAPGSYEDIVPLGEGLFAAKQNGLYALMDDAGSMLTDAEFSLLHIEKGQILACRNGSWGMLYADGSEKTPFEYSMIVPGDSRNCWALRGDPNDMDSDKLYRIGPDGRQHATRIYVRSMGHASADGLLRVMPSGGGKYGYCDELGRMTIPAVYDYAGDFVNGAAAVVLDGRYGAISRSGEEIVPAEYSFLEVTESGLILAAKERGGAYVFRADGSELARFEGADIYIASVGSGFAVVDTHFLFVYSQEGRLVLEAPSSSVVLEGIGGELIISDGMWGEECVYLSGTARKYQNLYPLGTAKGKGVYAYMKADVGRYMNDLLGEIQLSVDMDSARYGIADHNGEPVTACVYHSVEYLADDRLLVRTDEAWQMIDSLGSVLWEHAAPRQTAAPSS